MELLPLLISANPWNAVIKIANKHGRYACTVLKTKALEGLYAVLDIGTLQSLSQPWTPLYMRPSVWQFGLNYVTQQVNDPKHTTNLQLMYWKRKQSVLKVSKSLSLIWPIWCKPGFFLWGRPLKWTQNCDIDGIKSWTKVKHQKSILEKNKQIYNMLEESRSLPLITSQKSCLLQAVFSLNVYCKNIRAVLLNNSQQKSKEVSLMYNFNPYFFPLCTSKLQMNMIHLPLSALS